MQLLSLARLRGARLPDDGGPRHPRGALRAVVGQWRLCRVPAFARVIFFFLRWVVGVRVEVRGPVPTGEVLVAAKHQSFLDILMIFEALPRAKFIMKKELKWAPFIGLYALRIGSTPVARGDRAKAMKAMVEHAGRDDRAAAAGDLSAGDAGGAGGAAAVQGRAPGCSTSARASPACRWRPMPGCSGGAGRWSSGPAWRWWSSCPTIPPNLAIPEFMARMENAVEDASDRLMREAGFEPGTRAEKGPRRLRRRRTAPAAPEASTRRGSPTGGAVEQRRLGGVCPS